MMRRCILCQVYIQFRYFVKSILETISSRSLYLTFSVVLLLSRFNEYQDLGKRNLSRASNSFSQFLSQVNQYYFDVSALFFLYSVNSFCTPSGKPISWCRDGKKIWFHQFVSKTELVVSKRVTANNYFRSSERFFGGQHETVFVGKKSLRSNVSCGLVSVFSSISVSVCFLNKSNKAFLFI